MCCAYFATWAKEDLLSCSTCSSFCVYCKLLYRSVRHALLALGILKVLNHSLDFVDCNLSQSALRNIWHSSARITIGQIVTWRTVQGPYCTEPRKHEIEDLRNIKFKSDSEAESAACVSCQRQFDFRIRNKQQTEQNFDLEVYTH